MKGNEAIEDNNGDIPRRKLVYDFDVVEERWRADFERYAKLYSVIW